jgi:hypothetical protein
MWAMRGCPGGYTGYPSGEHPKDDQTQMRIISNHIAAFLFTLLFITGCAVPNRPVVIERKTYHSLSADKLAGKTFEVLIVDENQRGSLEFSEHVDKLSSYLTSNGMIRKAAGKEPADYTVFFLFNIAGRERTAARSVPHFNVTGGTSSFNATTYGKTGTYNTYGTVTSYPTLQYAGSSTHISSYTEYSRIVIIRMYSAEGMTKKNAAPVFETTAHSDGVSRDTTKLVPVLLDGLLFDFPGVSGSSDVQERILLQEEK